MSREIDNFETKLRNNFVVELSTFALCRIDKIFISMNIKTKLKKKIKRKWTKPNK